MPAAFREVYPDSEIDWLIRSDFKDLLNQHPLITHVISFDREQGLGGLLKLARGLAREKRYTHIYDAHNNLRSHLFTLVYLLTAVVGGPKSSPLCASSKGSAAALALFPFSPSIIATAVSGS